MIKAELLAIGIPILGLRSDNEEDTVDEVDPFKFSKKFGFFFLSFKLRYFCISSLIVSIFETFQKIFKTLVLCF